jgi:pyruvate dehydrogenase E1 component
MKNTYNQKCQNVEAGILKGMYLLQSQGSGKIRVQLFGSGTILREVIAAAELLDQDFGIAADVWSITSFNELHRDGIAVQRANMFSPEKKPQQAYITQCLAGHEGPVIAATDYVRAYAEQVRPHLNRSYTVLGTDGYGRSDTREKLREFFEVNRYYVAVAALYALSQDGHIPAKKVTEALKKYNIDPKKPNPITV